MNSNKSFNRGTSSTVWSGLKPSRLVEGTVSLMCKKLKPMEKENSAIWSKIHKLGFIYGNIAMSLKIHGE